MIGNSPGRLAKVPAIQRIALGQPLQRSLIADEELHRFPGGESGRCRWCGCSVRRWVHAMNRANGRFCIGLNGVGFGGSLCARHRVSSTGLRVVGLWRDGEEIRSCGPVSARLFGLIERVIGGFDQVRRRGFPGRD